jgi:DNA repair ATPase RecN
MSEWSTPDPNEVRYAFSSLVQNFDSFLSFVSTEKSPRFSDYINRLQSIVMELIQIHGELARLIMDEEYRRELQRLTPSYKVEHRPATINYRKYKKACENVWKIMPKLTNDVHHLEEKHEEETFFWESAFQKGKMRKDLIKFYKDISKQLMKIQKNIS